ncbi:MAG: YggS family pyridoxal phosphate-dependent enzyme [Ignavibacteriae bacterium]|nr:YggS family pyridoxal phosphate-dependent enzyme [Ignavibacteriota bacterium]
MKYDYLKENYSELVTDIKGVCTQVGKNYDDIKLVAVSKTFPPEEILEVKRLGHADFGENKVQELKSKFDELKSENINWHLVGHLQTNKVKYIADFVTLIHSVDSFKLAEEIDRHAKKAGRIINILVQVNTSDELQKSGIEPSDAKNLCREISSLENINLQGLMTIGMFTDVEEIIRENFRMLKDIFDDLKVDYPGFRYLSMGMTSDYRIAIEEGSNMLRIGSAIFGKRNYL